MFKPLKIASFIALLSLAIGALTACGTTSPIDASQVHLTTQAIANFNYDGRNCPVTAFDMPGQGLRAMGSGLRAMGSVGGLLVSHPDSPLPSQNPQAAARYLNRYSDFDASKEVAIIILDEFSFDGVNAYTLSPDIRLLTRAAVLGEETLQSSFMKLRRKGKISHGALVLSHLNGLLAASPDTSFIKRVDDTTFLFERKGKRIIVKLADVRDLDTDAIYPALQGAFSDLSANYGVENVVVNMSFSLVPCQILENARAEGFDTLEQYLNVLADALGTEPDALMLELSNLVDPTKDTLLGKLNNLLGTGVLVAAAGNYQGSYPMFPAASPEVVSVSSFDLPSFKFSRIFSNAGEVAAPGYLFRVYDPVTGLRINNLAYAGTSFSAPAVSLFSAFDLAQANPRCFTSNAATDLATGTFSNTPLHRAVNRCSL